jgi:hypothetical protein
VGTFEYPALSQFELSGENNPFGPSAGWLLGAIRQMAFDLSVRRVEDSLDVQPVALRKCLKRRGSIAPSHRL